MKKIKELHLICNSHIDPVWQWDWEEGLGVTVSTFKQAADFCDEYDYVFCHNESILYEYIEKIDPELFARIQNLVKQGKWVIAGGWYLQPDINLPSGEAMVRQIKLGRKYFEDKFGARPSVAYNFDGFGHSVGLVQILKKCGFDGYIFCRPMKEYYDIPDNMFIWNGVDGSTVKAVRATESAKSLKTMRKSFRTTFILSISFHTEAVMISRMALKSTTRRFRWYRFTMTETATL